MVCELCLNKAITETKTRQRAWSKWKLREEATFLRLRAPHKSDGGADAKRPRTQCQESHRPSEAISTTQTGGACNLVFRITWKKLQVTEENRSSNVVPFGYTLM